MLVGYQTNMSVIFMFVVQKPVKEYDSTGHAFLKAHTYKPCPAPEKK